MDPSASAKKTTHAVLTQYVTRFCDYVGYVYVPSLCRRKKNKSNLENLSGQLDKDLVLRDVPNGASRPARMVAPAGVERFSDDEEETIDFNAV